MESARDRLHRDCASIRSPILPAPYERSPAQRGRHPAVRYGIHPAGLPRGRRSCTLARRTARRSGKRSAMSRHSPFPAGSRRNLARTFVLIRPSDGPVSRLAPEDRPRPNRPRALPLVQPTAVSVEFWARSTRPDSANALVRTDSANCSEERARRHSTPHNMQKASEIVTLCVWHRKDHPQELRRVL